MFSSSTHLIDRAQRSYLSAEQRLAHLLDPGSIEQAFETPGFKLAWGKIDGREVGVLASDPAINHAIGTTHNIPVATQMVRACTARRVPLFSLLESPGADIDGGPAIERSFIDFFTALDDASGVIPMVSVVLGKVVGGADYACAFSDLVIMNRERGYLYLTGPRVHAIAIGGELTHDQLGGPELHKESGRVALFGSNEIDSIEQAKGLMSYLPASSEQFPTTSSNAFSDPIERELGIELISNILGRIQMNFGYDSRCLVREILDRTSDRCTFLELWSKYAPNIVTGLGHLGGEPVGVIANNSHSIYAGSLELSGSRKIERFVHFCDAFHIPLLNLVDTPGVWSDPQTQRGDVEGLSIRVFRALRHASVPQIALYTHKGYGGAFCLQANVGTNAHTFAWKTAKMDVMGAAGAVEILHGSLFRDLAQPKASIDGCRRKQSFGSINDIRLRLIAARQERLRLSEAKEVGLVGQVIEQPSRTREIIARDLISSMLQYRKRTATFKHSSLSF